MSAFNKIYIDDNIYRILIRLLHNKTGLNFKYYNRKFIEKRIKSRMIRVKLTTLASYYDYLFSNDAELKKFIEAFNINYTYFFRDWEVFQAFNDIFIESLKCKKEKIVSLIKPDPSQIARFHTKENLLKIQRKKKRTEINKIEFTSYLNKFSLLEKIEHPKDSIKIWSCPCASGEEPYTIAMILDNLRRQIPNFPDYKIVASDIDRDAIKDAKTGIYNDDSMKNITDFYKTTYFNQTKKHFGYNYSISDFIKKDVEFIVEDVTKVHVKPWKYDIIFCRYLLIYFNRENREKFIKIIENRLNENGILIIGKTETLFSKFNNLRLIDTKNHIYMKNSSN